MAASSDAPPPPWGPGFLRLNAWVYRLEYAVGFVAIVGVLLGWRWLVVRDLPLTAIGLAVFWFLWPDVAAFVPIGLATRGGGRWPRWGPALYNSVHTFLTWGAVLVTWSVAVGAIQWPLLGWAAHLAMDRAAGFYLRAPSPTN
jgi:hypothetical protein